MRNRSLSGVRDPLQAQEWAYARWDEYLAELRLAWKTTRVRDFVRKAT